MCLCERLRFRYKQVGCVPGVTRAQKGVRMTWNAYRGKRVSVFVVLAGALAALGVCARDAGAASWEPDRFAKEDTLKLRTSGPKEGEYWFPVWLVVIEGQVYVRLGTRAAGRVQENTSTPYLGVDVAGQRFDHVRGVPALESAERVAQAMAAKYTSDIIVRWFSHPLTLRLVPEEPPAAPAAP